MHCFPACTRLEVRLRVFESRFRCMRRSEFGIKLAVHQVS
jgi:hypothetical protein